MVLAWGLLWLPLLVLGSVCDEQLLEIGRICSVVFRRSSNRFRGRDAWRLVIFFLHMNCVGRSFRLKLANQAGSYQVRSVVHLVDNFLGIHFLGHILARERNACIVVLLLLLRISLLEKRLMTWIMTQTINNWRHKFMIGYLLFHVCSSLCWYSPQ